MLGGRPNAKLESGGGVGRWGPLDAKTNDESKGRRLPTGRDKQWNISGVKPEIAPSLLDKAEDRASRWVKVLEWGAKERK
jgi:hypothetical protein